MPAKGAQGDGGYAESSTASFASLRQGMPGAQDRNLFYGPFARTACDKLACGFLQASVDGVEDFPRCHLFDGPGRPGDLQKRLGLRRVSAERAGGFLNASSDRVQDFSRRHVLHGVAFSIIAQRAASCTKRASCGVRSAIRIRPSSELS